MTYTYVELAISAEAFKEIEDKLRTADYGHAFKFSTKNKEVVLIDMHGIALVKEKK